MTDPWHEEFHALPGTGGPTLERVLARADRKRRRVPAVVATGLALAAGLLLALPERPDTRLKAIAPSPEGSVHLSLAAEGDRGLRPLAPGARLEPGERVLIQLDSSAEGHAWLLDGDTVVWPLAGQDWQVPPGPSALGGADLQAYGADEPGTRPLTVVVCPTPIRTAGCAEDGILLTWP